MDDNNERRREDRLEYRWPVWFSEDFAKTMSQGLMVDIASGGIAFVCDRSAGSLSNGQHLTIRFSIPRFEGDDPTATVSVTRAGDICRIEEVGDGSRRVAVEFDTPLAVHPAEITSLKAHCSQGPLMVD
ncbi:MAG: PilZ domain-containing protein [Sedimentisphaerales bacterium]|nr:PilZ domain-containing protein [Sedimentisphaerales bacterium]